MSHDPFVGKVIDGRYEIQARVGEGGMGVVYKSRQISIDRVIALKMLNAQMAADPQWVQRFYNEAKACSRLQHPNTIRMFDFGQTSDGRLFMTMEFLDGVSLRDAIQKGPLAPQRVVKILIQCCASLAEAHSIGIIHRDIKPDNVFLLNMAGSPDFVKLLDFSVAKLLEGDRMKTQAGVVFGTPQYMSPEQGRGLPLDARSDLYALGILAFEMLTGNVPFNDENPMTVIQMHLQGQIPPMPDSVPYSVQQIVRRALEKDAGRRYQSSGEMMQHCQQVFAELTNGNVAPGGGGAPRTVVAPGGIPGGMPPGMGQQGHMQQPHMQQGHMQQPHMQQPPQGMQQPPQQQGYSAASPQQKTMMAQVSPFQQGGSPQQMGGQPSGLSQGGYSQAPPNQKTIVAGMAPQIGMPQGVNVPGAPPGFQPGMPPGMGQPGGQPQGGGANKTMMLQPSDGVVSVARTGQALQPAAGPATSEGPAVQQGASALFWIMSMIIGIGLGVLGYVIVLQTQ
ncbi:MAG: serine/threonine protein kinase [Deltaproteobacteria bacterium]|nr:serine/threonine protein kinase [Deltaproteobacteria bacterium]